jgi:type II secretory pathway component GspD/PulD (secretin)
MGQVLSRLLVVLALCMAVAQAAHAAQAAAIEVIELRHRTAAEMIPLLEPLLGPDEVLTGTGMRLVLRSGPTTLREMRRILETLDVAPVNLVISVRRGALGGSSELDLDVQGRAGSVVIGDGSGTRVIRRQTADRDSSVQTLRVLEGQTALIRTGESVPTAQPGLIVWPRGGVVTSGVEFRDVERGFLVRPRVGGDDRVRLEITQVHERASRAVGGQIDFQQVDTVLVGRFGEWIRIAGVGERRDASGQRILGASRAQREEQMDIHVRVDRAE